MYNEILQEIIQLNFLPLGIAIFLTIFIIYNKGFNDKVIRYFKLSIILLVLLVIDDNLDYQFAKTGMPIFIHTITAVMGYILRLLIMLSLIFIVNRQYSNKDRLWVSIPLFITVIVESSAFYSSYVFYYTDSNELVRSWLSYTPHFVSLVYVVILFRCGIKRLRTRNMTEGIIIITAVILVVLATTVETLYQLRGILIGIISLNMMSYYLYLYIETFTIDSLTGALNRTAFSFDILHEHRITGIISIDLNDLKKANDSKGHQYGDELLKTLVKDVTSVLRKGCYLYRIGGDEFIIICNNLLERDVIHLYNKLIKKRGKSKVSWSMGYAINKGVVQDCINVADKLMYDDKKEQKK